MTLETNCIRCGARLDIAENQSTEAQRQGKAFATRYCAQCVVKLPTLEPIVEIPVRPKHYIAMSGSHGCLPDHCEVFETYADAVADLVQLFELGRTRAARLKKNSYLELVPSPIESRDEEFGWGAEYCEIQTCDCDKPAVNSDSQ